MAFAKIHPALRAATVTVNGVLYYLTSTNINHTVRSRCGKVRVHWPLSNDEYQAQPDVTVNGVPVENYAIKLPKKGRYKQWSLV